MKLRRFSQLGWHGCMDLVAAAAGHHVVRVELGEPPKKKADEWTVGFDEVGPMTTDIVDLVEAYPPPRKAVNLHPAQKRFLESELTRPVHVPGVSRGRRWGMT